MTQILQATEAGDLHTAEELLPLVYGELRRLAHTYMARETPGQTLQPTALVHEAYMRLAGGRDLKWESRKHFFATAARAMRRILVDRARKSRTVKHGGDYPGVSRYIHPLEMICIYTLQACEHAPAGEPVDTCIGFIGILALGVYQCLDSVNFRVKIQGRNNNIQYK